MRFFILLLIFLLLTSQSVAQVSPVQVSYLPNGRSGSPNTPITVFGTLVNSGSDELSCSPRFGGFVGGLPDGVTGQLRFFPWDGTSVTGTANQSITIPAGGRQDYIVEATFSAPFDGRITANLRCQDASSNIFDVPRLPAANDLSFTITDAAGPDILIVADTLSNDGVTRISADGPRVGLMVVAAVNIGTAAPSLSIEAGITEFAGLNQNLDITVCETNTSGVCQSSRARSIDVTNWETDEVRFFAVRVIVPPELGVPFYPDILRLVVSVQPSTTTADGPLDEIAREVLLSGYGRFGLSYAGTALESSIDRRLQVEISERRLRAEFGLDLQAFECHSRLDNDMAATTARNRGAFRFGAAGQEGFTALGYLGLGDFNGTEYLQPLEVTGSDWLNSSTFTVSAFGTGVSDQVFSDIQFGTSGVFSPNLSFRFRWSGDDSFNNDFQAPGRTRCAPVPAWDDEVPRDMGLSPFNGNYEFGQPLAGASTMTINNDQVLMRDLEPGDTIAPLDGEVAGSDTQPPLDPAEIIFINFIDLFLTGLEAGVIFPVPFDPGDGGPKRFCGTMVLEDSPREGSTPNQDADVEDFTPEFPEDLGDSECIL